MPIRRILQETLSFLSLAGRSPREVVEAALAHTVQNPAPSLGANGARRIGDSRLWLAVGPLSPGFLVVQSHQIVGVPVAILLG